MFIYFFFSSRRRHTRYWRDWSSDVCSSDLKYIYINGELQGETADSRPTMDLTQFYAQRGFYIGQSANDDRYMNGYVSEARVWATARSAAELKNNVCWVDPLSEGLVAYWRFNRSEEHTSELQSRQYLVC